MTRASKPLPSGCAVTCEGCGSATTVASKNEVPLGGEGSAQEYRLGKNGNLDVESAERKQDGKDLCQVVLSGAMTLNQVEGLLIQAAVDKACGNLSAAARMLGLTRPQLAYRLGTLNDEGAIGGGQASSAASRAAAS